MLECSLKTPDEKENYSFVVTVVKLAADSYTEEALRCYIQMGRDHDLNPSMAFYSNSDISSVAAHAHEGRGLSLCSFILSEKGCHVPTHALVSNGQCSRLFLSTKGSHTAFYDLGGSKFISNYNPIYQPPAV